MAAPFAIAYDAHDRDVFEQEKEMCRQAALEATSRAPRESWSKDCEDVQLTVSDYPKITHNFVSSSFQDPLGQNRFAICSAHAPIIKLTALKNAYDAKTDPACKASILKSRQQIEAAAQGDSR